MIEVPVTQNGKSDAAFFVFDANLEVLQVGGPGTIATWPGVVDPRCGVH